MRFICITVIFLFYIFTEEMVEWITSKSKWIKNLKQQIVSNNIQTWLLHIFLLKVFLFLFYFIWKKCKHFFVIVHCSYSPFSSLTEVKVLKWFIKADLSIFYLLEFIVDTVWNAAILMTESWNTCRYQNQVLWRGKCPRKVLFDRQSCKASQ